MAFAPWAAHALTYTVTTTTDGGAGSLRTAIFDANANCGSDPSPVIQFNIPGTGPFVISSSAPLNFSCALGPYSPTVDGYSQPGASANTLLVGWNASTPIEVAKSSFAYGSFCGFSMDNFDYGGQLTIKGLVIRNFSAAGDAAICGFGAVTALGNVIRNNDTGILAPSGSVIGGASPASRNLVGSNAQSGIQVSYGGSVSIIGNYVGTLNGSTAAPNSTGISAAGDAFPNRVIQDNVISGNAYGGIFLNLDGSSDVSSNLIGLNAAGTAALPNGADGIQILQSSGTRIESNVISGNAGAGVYYSDSNAIDVMGNHIGLDGDTGTTAIPNGFGVQVLCGSGSTIGGNHISGNTGEGIILQGSDATAVSINIIGLAVGGGPLGNGGNGVKIQNGTCFSGETGINHLLFQNQIAHNAFNGVLMLGTGTGHKLDRTRAYSNGVKNININDTVGPLPNDAGDADPGPNNQQNYPVIGSVTQAGGNTTVNYTMDTAAGSTYTVQFFSNPAAGIPAGQTFLQEATGVAATGSFSITIAGLHNHISATATRVAAPLDSSEYSPMASVVLTPGVTVAPTSHDFGDVTVGTTSPSQTFTLTSTGTAPYQITALGSDASCTVPICSSGDFTCSTDCSTLTAYNAGQSCTITASFSPIATGAQAATVFVCDNTSTSPQSIALAGNGTAVPPSGVSLSASSMAFGDVQAGTTSAPQTVTLTSTGGSPYQISSFNSAPTCDGPPMCSASDFNCTTTCTTGTNYTNGQTCTVSATFSPGAVGPQADTIYICDNAPTTPQAVSLTGNGTAVPTPGVNVNPTSLSFGDVQAGSASGSQTVTLTSTGTAPYQISSFNSAPTCDGPPMCSAGSFVCSTTCTTGTNYANGQACTVSASFAPSAVGPQSEIIYVCDNTSSSPQSISLTGNGTAVPTPGVSVSPTGFNFGDVQVGSSSPPKTFTLASTGTAPYQVSSFNSAPTCDGPPMCSGTGFSCATTCGTAPTSYASGQSCTINATFAPSATGAQSTNIYVCDNTSTSPQVISLSGNATPIPPAAVSLSSNAMNFGQVPLGSSSASQSVTLTSTGATPYKVSSLNSAPTCDGPAMCTGSSFSCSTTCSIAPASYGSGQSCTVSATFNASVIGSHSTKIYVCDNTPGGPQIITLAGEAVPPPIGNVTITPASFDFGRVLVGTRSAPRAFRITNRGGASAPIGSVATTGPFPLLGHECTATLAPGTSCLATVAFAPPAAGAANGQLVVSSLASGPSTPASTASAALSGTGVASTAPPPPPPEAELLLPTAIDLGNYTIGGPPLSRSIRLHNTGTGPLTFSRFELTGPFTLVNNCPTILAADGECTLVIGFSATSPGAAQGTLTIVSNARGGSGAIPVTALAVRAPVALVRISPVQVGFGDRLIGTTSAAQRIVVSNEGGAAAAITGIVPSDDFILLGTSCGSTLAADQSCFADIAMRPTGFGPRTGALLINTTAAGSPHRVTLSGRGCRPFVAIGNRSGPRENCAP